MKERRALPDWPAAMGEELASAYVDLSPAAFRRLVAAGQAPRPIRLTPGRVLWRRADLDRWIAPEEAAPLRSSAEIFAHG